MNAKLLVILGNKTKREVGLQLPAVLGRSRSADITVAHPLISRRHCEISENNGLLMIRDLSSLNGTMIGGRRIELAPLLPDSEFTIGPLMFRVLYEYEGDLESVPDTRFVEGAEGAAEAAFGGGPPAGSDKSPVLEVDDAQPGPPANESRSDEFVLPDLMALADADAEEVLPARPAPAVRAPRSAASGSRWPPVAIDKLPTVPLRRVPDEPMEFDSSLQSGSHRAESPWGVDPPAMENLGQIPRASPQEEPPVLPKTPPAPAEPPPEEAAKPPTKEKRPAPSPPPPNPPKRPSYGEEIDPEFGSFLEGLE